jgi:hypothetical protein
MEHFRLQGYDVSGEATIDDGWHVSIAKGSMFAAVLGMRTALNVDLKASEHETLLKAGVGIFGRQVVPVLIARFIAWPVWLTQIWGLVQQARLDDEAIECAERSLLRHATRVSQVEPQVEPGAGGAPEGQFCTSCGGRLPAGARFCPACGAPAT